MKFHPDMIANVLSLNETTKNYQVTFNSWDENDLKVHIVDNIVKFPDNDDGIYFSKHNKVLFRKLCEDNKSNMIEGLNNLKNVGGNNKGISKSQYKRAPVARKIYHIVGAPDLQILRMIIIQNIINNFPVTVEDIEIA